MLTSGIYDYIDVMDKAADAAWQRNTAISNNIANQSTPGYKRQEVDFEGTLRRELSKFEYVSLDEKVSDLHLDHLTTTAYTDAEGYSYRLDGNNVDPEQEYGELISNRIRYNALIDSIDRKSTRLNSSHMA